jgi:hypothetical protein
MEKVERRRRLKPRARERGAVGLDLKKEPVRLTRFFYNHFILPFLIPLMYLKTNPKKLI